MDGGNVENTEVVDVDGVGGVGYMLATNDGDYMWNYIVGK